MRDPFQVDNGGRVLWRSRHDTAPLPLSRLDEMSSLAREYGAIDLCLGVPDFGPPVEIVQGAMAALLQPDAHVYPDSRGSAELREEIAASVTHTSGRPVDPETDITVTCGATEAMFLALAVVLTPQDEVVLFQPGYETYAPVVQWLGGRVKPVRLHAPHRANEAWRLDMTELTSAFTGRTRAVVVNTPHNPTGRTFTCEEMLTIAEICRRYDCWLITDEIYERFVFDGVQHVSGHNLTHVTDRVIVISGLSKTFGIPGFRLGYLIAPAALNAAVRALHESFTAGVPAPMQAAGVAALRLSSEYYATQRAQASRRCRFLTNALNANRFRCASTQGGWYIMAQSLPVPATRQVRDVAMHLVRCVGVAAEPGEVFYQSMDPEGPGWLRFCFWRSDTVLQTVAGRLAGAGQLGNCCCQGHFHNTGSVRL